MLTTKQAAVRLGLKSYRTVVQYIRRRRLTAEVRTERGMPVYYISEEELTRFERERQVGPGNKTGAPRRPVIKGGIPE